MVVRVCMYIGWWVSLIRVPYLREILARLCVCLFVRLIRYPFVRLFALRMPTSLHTHIPAYTVSVCNLWEEDLREDKVACYGKSAAEDNNWELKAHTGTTQHTEALLKYPFQVDKVDN